MRMAIKPIAKKKHHVWFLISKSNMELNGQLSLAILAYQRYVQGFRSYI
jgi:hypothetical protein